MFIADFHTHSKYSRATSKECVPEVLDMWARRKGLHLIGTGDFTHAAWREELKEKLVTAEDGLYTLKKEFRREDSVAGEDFRPRFILSSEISSIYKKNGKVRKIHNLILLPGIEEADALSRRLEAVGNLHSDGRPILGLDSRDLLEITLEVCPQAIFIPAHIWTPHFSLFGAYSGFDDIRECFEDLTGYIHALETGLSSNPPMNWQLSALDSYTMVSNSDAHSPGNLAREANLFDTALSYSHIARALENRNTKEFYGTIEFYPEEGKYHYDGHRACKVCQKPADTRAASGICPVCGGRITVGVLHRVEALADRMEGFVPPGAKYFESLVPLAEVISASSGYTSASIKGREIYDSLLHSLGPELFILREAPLADIERKAGPLVAEGIRRLRCSQVEIQPGYDGEYGKVSIMDKHERDLFSGQLCLFSNEEARKPPDPPQNALKPDKPAQASAENIPQAANSPARTVPRLYDFNPQQWEAVTSLNPATVVVAGPGTGKTKTLVGRIAYLVEKCGVSPSEITAITFTNKAAGEIRARLEKHFTDKRKVKAMTIGTFHSICLQALSEQNPGAGVTVIDETGALSVIKDILQSLEMKQSPRDMLRGISLIKNGAGLPDDIKLPREVYDLYCGQLAHYGVLDYDDILLNILRQLESRDGVEAAARNRPNPAAHLLVDEFQDINPVQYRLIRQWGQDSGSIFVIGDPDQSIYGFRGSDPRCFEWLGSDYPHLRQINLNQNYRSTPEIIHCAASVISKAPGRASGSLLKAHKESGGKVRLLEAAEPFSEALFVVKEINRMVGGIDMLESGKGHRYGHLRGFSDIAVLYRTNRQAGLIEQCLLKEGIPYVVSGRDSFLSEPQVFHTVAFFRFLLCQRDILSLKVCLREMWGYSAELTDQALERYGLTERSMKALTDILESLPVSPAGPEPEALISLLRRYEPLVAKEKPRKLIEAWIEDNALAEVPCMEMLLNTAVMHEKMASLLQTLLLGRESDVIRSGKRQYSKDAVSLMTLHGAKGLEFPVVFLCGASDGLIPFRDHRGICNLEEERRLFYVGMTRAQEELILLTSGQACPFLADLPKEPLDKAEAFVRRPGSEFEQFSLFD